MNETEIIIAEPQEAKVQRWLKKHKKEIIAAGISVIAITGLVICVKNKDAVLEFLKRFEADAKCDPSGINSLTVENVIAGSTENVRMYTAPTSPYNVEQHIRNLPEGRHHSAEKAAQAIILGIDLLPNQTIVNSYTKGLAA